MTSRFLATSVTCASICVFVSLARLPVTAQAPGSKTTPTPKAGAPRTWTVPRTPDGQPDFQGLWTNGTVTPLERPQGAAEFLTPEQIAAAEKRGNRDQEAEEDAQRTTQDEERIAANARPRPGAEPTGNYNAVWWELGKKALANNRSSIITGPSGRLPHTPEAVKQIEDNREYLKTHPADSADGRDNIERCIAWITSGPPMLPTFYNNTYQIFQTPHYVAIQVEMIHDVRIIPLDGRPHPDPAVRQWMGDSRGHWEGDTLVVETTNLNSKRGYIGGGSGRGGLAPNADMMRVIERFTRTAPDILRYQFTVENPAIYTQPWSGEIPMRATKEPLYEYACHEGNYALVDILSGARADEKAQAAKERGR